MCLELVVVSFVFGGVCLFVLLLFLSVCLFFLLKNKYGFCYFVVIVVVWEKVSRL